MNILITISRLHKTAGGAQRSSIELANELDKRGHGVTLISFEPVVERVISHYRINKGVEVAIVPSPSGPSRALSKLIDSSAAASTVFSDELLWFDAYLATADAFINVLRSVRPDIVLSFLPSTFTATAKVLEYTNIPFVVANRNDPVWDYSPKRYSSNTYDLQMRKRAVEIATLNLVQIEAYKKYFKEHKTKTYIIPNPIKHLVKPNAAKQTNTIISVGRLEPVKNQQLLIEAFALIADKYPDWRVEIYGDGSLRDELEKLIQQRRLVGRVQLKGVTKNIQGALFASKIFAFPSLIEGFSRALGEALSAGLPSVVIAECVSNRYLIEASGAGLVAKNKAKSFAKRLKKLINDDDLREKMSRRAREYTVNFEPTKVYDRWEDLLTGAAGQGQKIDHDMLEAARKNIHARYKSLLDDAKRSVGA